MDKMTAYLQDEVRSGFYIPTAIKQAWAVQLKILAEIDRICVKYDIAYYAEWGTLLGAVRHGGFVPWDDDLDIGMKRADYQRFLEVAEAELPEGYAIHNYATKDNHWLFLARVVNTNHISFDKEHLDKFYNFPYIATVDIFVSDYRYADSKKEEERCDEIKRILAVADGIVEGRLSDEAIDRTVEEINKCYNCKIKKGTSANDMGVELYRLAEQLMGRVSYAEADNIVQIFPWGLKGNTGLPKQYYEEFIRLPFEGTTIPVPAKYNQVLSARYGDYMKVQKIWGGHDYPYFEGQRANLQAVADFKLPEFEFNEGMLRENNGERDRSGSLKAIAVECIRELDNLVGCVGVSIDGDMLTTCQQLAVDLGTLIEKVKGEDDKYTRLIVTELEGFCESIFRVYETLTTEGIADVQERLISLETSLERVKDVIKEHLLGRIEVLFVAAGASMWREYADIYNEMIAIDNIDVRVVAVPTYRKDVYGRIINVNEDMEDISAVYPDELHIDIWEMYDIELHSPEIVYIQNPYDGENPCLTIPPTFYAGNLQRYTDKLIYVQAYKVNEFSKEDTTDVYNMKHYVSAPGVVYADEIVVQSENIRDRYIERLTEFAGQRTKELWEQRVVVRRKSGDIKGNTIKYNDSGIDKGGIVRRKLVFGIGANELSEHEDVIIEALRSRLKLFAEHKDRLEVYVFLYPYNLVIKNGNVYKLLMEYKTEKWFWLMTGEENADYYMQELAETKDAYYGSPMPLAHYFERAEKPVMIADFSI